MNGVDALDVLDVVVMVEIILGGGMGDVGDLLNTVTGQEKIMDKKWMIVSGVVVLAVVVYFATCGCCSVA